MALSCRLRVRFFVSVGEVRSAIEIDPGSALGAMAGDFQVKVNLPLIYGLWYALGCRGGHAAAVLVVFINRSRRAVRWLMMN